MNKSRNYTESRASRFALIDMNVSIFMYDMISTVAGIMYETTIEYHWVNVLQKLSLFWMHSSLYS